jgi:cytochrome c biogenesis protein CcdA/peroxiredoxin
VEITVGLALIAGFVSFISPCVLPLVPAYIGYMGGRVSSAAAGAAGSGTVSVALSQRLNTFLHSVFFVLGFTLVFVTLGLLSTAFVQQIGGGNIRLLTDAIGRLGGVLIIGFGLHYLGVLPSLFRWLRANATRLDHAGVSLALALASSALLLWGFHGDAAFWTTPTWANAPLISSVGLAMVVGLWVWLVSRRAFTPSGAFLVRLLDSVESALYSDTRRSMVARSQGSYLDSAVMGVIFSAGWTPCIGPVYGAVLTMAANGGDVGRAGALLATYALGLGIPFLLTALLLDGAQVWLRRLQRHLRTIERLSGAFLIVIGVAVASGQLQRLSQQFAGDFAEFSIEVEERVIALVTGTDTLPDGEAATVTEANADAEVGLDIGMIAPDFASVTADGAPIALSDLRGRVVLLNFWATWCGPCRIEMPGFQRQYLSHADDGFVVLAVNNAEPLELIAPFRDQLGLTFPILMDTEGAIQRQYGIINYPSTMLLDRDGRIVARHFGVVTPPQIDAMLAEIGFTS